VNTINASLEFHYQGELYSAAATIDLDKLMEKQSAIPSLHSLLAAEANIDPYSYQYEMLEAEEICFRDAQGIASEYLHGEQFDIAGFESAWRENKKLQQLQSIAKERLDIDDLGKNPELKEALLEAYQVGRAAAKKDND
jgi:hypothetical protein